MQIPRKAGARRHTRRMGRASLFTRIFLLEVAVFALAGLVLALTPATVSAEIALREAVVLFAVLAATLAVSFLLLRHAFRPLRQLTELMETVDPLHPGSRLPVYGDDEEIRRLTAAFNEMLARLEVERRESVRRSLAAQEGERLRVAQELHDGVGQSLTALMLQLGRAAQAAPPPLRDELADAREAARALLGEVRDVAGRLRPEALDDLGLANALAALAQRVAEQSGLPVRRAIDAALPPLSPQAELVIYRVAQEGLANALRHADASSVELSLRAVDDTIALTVRDDGRGLDGSTPGAGIQGMHERALLLEAVCDLTTLPQGGTEVRLEVDAGAAAP